MKKVIAAFMTAGLVGIGFSSPLFAQQSKAESRKDTKKETREAAAASSLYVISAKAGAVNYVDGKVSLEKSKGKAKSGYLVKGDVLENEDKVKTNAQGRAEILLNPGSYVRLAENSEFKFISNSLEDLKVRLNAGSAIFEVITDGAFDFVVETPKSSFKLAKSGIYRLDALSDGSGKMTVWKGRAYYGQGKKDYVKGGQTTAIINGQTTVQKFDKDNKGGFEQWSKERAKEITAATAKLQQRTMSRSLISSFANDPWGNSWGRSNRFGLWVFDPISRGHCFLPFSYGSSSPYGFGYSSSIWNYNLPPTVYNNINPNWNNNVNNQQNQTNSPQYPNNNNNGNRPSQPSAPPAGNLPQSPPMATPIERPTREIPSPGVGDGGRFRVEQRPVDN